MEIKLIVGTSHLHERSHYYSRLMCIKGRKDLVGASIHGDSQASTPQVV
jgi:hypothetical protein